MGTLSTTKIPSDPALDGPWTAYRTWAATARYHKDAIDILTRWSLRLAIGGAVVATLGEQIGPVVPALPWLSKALGAVGAAAIALAAYLSRQAQADDREGIWTRCRSAAESLKSAIFLCRASAPPFDGADRAARIRSQTEKAMEDMNGVEPRQPGPEGPPQLTPLTVDGYIAERVGKAVDWYRDRAAKHQDSADLCRQGTAVLMGISALLVVASAVSQLSMWAPVLGTITASITAHLKNQRYQMLIAMYLSTALRLELITGEWAATGKTDPDRAERNTMIQRCEETMASENGSWLALWSKKDSAKASSPTGEQPGQTGQ